MNCLPVYFIFSCKKQPSTNIFFPTRQESECIQNARTHTHMHAHTHSVGYIQNTKREISYLGLIYVFLNILLMSCDLLNANI